MAKQDVFQIFTSKYFFIPGIFLTIILIAGLLYFLNIPEKVIFPNPDNFRYDYYTDEANGGNSAVTEHFVGDSVLRLRFLLHDNFYSPYVGLSISPVNGRGFNVKKYNTFNILTSGQNLERLAISLYTPPLSIADSAFKDETLYHSYINIDKQIKKYAIPASLFQHPDWWEDMHRLEKHQNDRIDLQNLLRINIGSAFSPSIDNNKTLEIYRISFTRDSHAVLITAGTVYFVLLIFIAAMVYLNNYRKNKQKKVIVSYRSIEDNDHSSGEDKCIAYINSNYNNSNLTLEVISSETGIPSRKITGIIRDTFYCNFKTYLNRIRISESKRLLCNTDLNMGEIAFKVGFNSQSHFNRVFKSEIQISPSEYRDSLKA